jgi:DNA-binding phage protein
MATIADVARQAGVMPSTMSHALSGQGPVAAATRERIITAVRVGLRTEHHPDDLILLDVRLDDPRVHALRRR